MERRAGSSVLVRLGVSLLLVSAAAAVWETLASQAPTSPYHVGVLPGPVASLRETASLLGLCLFALAWRLPSLAPEREPWLLIGAITAGTIVTVLAMTYAATTGMLGVQIQDPRPDSHWLFLARSTGQAILGLCLLDVARRVFSSRA